MTSVIDTASKDAIKSTIFTYRTQSTTKEYIDLHTLLFNTNILGQVQDIRLLTNSTSIVQSNGGQDWYWTPEWQAMEQEADNDLQQGFFEDFDDMNEFINSLEELMGDE